MEGPFIIIAIYIQCSKLRVKPLHPEPGVHILAAGCMILECVHPAGAPFFQTFNMRITCAHIYRAGPPLSKKSFPVCRVGKKRPVGRSGFFIFFS